VRKPRIALVVPRLELIGGGIASVARFLKDTVLDSGEFELKLVSLATSARDECNLSITSPRTWRRGARSSPGVWEDLPFVHVGAVIGEPEFRRYQPRRVLADAVADCDILQAVCGSPAYANALIGLGKPVSVQCATRAKVERRRGQAHSHVLLGWWRKAMTAITDRVDDHVLRVADAIQVENSWMFEYARQLNNARSVDLRFAPPGVDDREFSPNGSRNVNGSPYAICVGRLDDPRKNIGLLLDAFALMPNREHERPLRLVIAGSAAPTGDFWRRADVLELRDRIQFVHRPSRAALVHLYQDASMFVLPSDEEGLGVTLLEAMSCGIPAVSTRSGGPDGVITDGIDGFLVPLDDAVALADRMSLLHGNQEMNCTMGRAARATVQRRFAKAVAGKAFLDVWQRLAGKSGINFACAASPVS
jgi:glycosyltransferase involved in cell wall biosynthesis